MQKLARLLGGEAACAVHHKGNAGFYHLFHGSLAGKAPVLEAILAIFLVRAATGIGMWDKDGNKLWSKKTAQKV